MPLIVMRKPVLATIIESVIQYEISSNVVCATSEDSVQPVHMCSLIRAFASRFVKLLTQFLSLTEAARARLNLQMPKYLS